MQSINGGTSWVWGLPRSIQPDQVQGSVNYEKAVNNSNGVAIEVRLFVRPSVAEGAIQKILRSGTLDPGQGAVILLSKGGEMPYLYGPKLRANLDLLVIVLIDRSRPPHPVRASTSVA